MNDRERFLAVMDYKPADRGIFGPGTEAWPETYRRWAREGRDPDHPPEFGQDRWIW